MNGPGHYAEAERLLAYVTTEGDIDVDTFGVDLILQAAQVHATLAQAAATADTLNPLVGENLAAWQNVLEGGGRDV
jgi:hypothetical protein